MIRFIIAVAFVLTQVESIIASSRFLSAYERKLNDIEKRMGNDESLIKNGRVKRIKCVEEYVPMEDTKTGSTWQKPQKKTLLPFNEDENDLGGTAMSGDARSIKERTFLDWLNRRNEIYVGDEERMANKHGRFMDGVINVNEEYADEENNNPLDYEVENEESELNSNDNVPFDEYNNEQLNDSFRMISAKELHVKCVCHKRLDLGPYLTSDG
ncbi:unnamed protein product [Anisakis simplex]|uniref:RxLR effector protein n=1 Tax=Anisakis simplex TaxID=6269 RepID=A0A0M3KD88_ANISI|nr:unnamed protein product [Anisakis simplex]